MKILMTIFFTFFVVYANAQDFDTITQSEILYKHDTVHHPVIEAFYYNKHFTKRNHVLIDTGIVQFQDYEPHMPISQNALSLGYFAAPSLALTEIQEFSPHFYQNPYSNRLFTNNTSLFYIARKPLTQVTYSFSGYEEQQISFFHTQNYSKDLNAGLRIRYYKGQGEYNKQAVSGRHIAPWISYTGDMYSLHALYSYNLLMHDENGGLIRDSLIEYPLSMIMNLSNAKSEKNFQEGLFLQKWNLGKRPLTADTTRTLLPVYKTAFGHAISYKKSQFFYTDSKPSSLFYPHIFHDSLQTHDTIKNLEIKNTVFFETTQGARKNTAIHLGVGHLYTSDLFFDARYQHPQTYWNNFFYEGEFIQKNIFGFELEHNHTFYFYGPSASDFTIHNELSKNFTLAHTHAMTFALQYDVSQTKPCGVLSQYQSNHAYWNSERASVFKQYLQGKIHSETGNIDLSASVSQMRNLLYFNENLELLQQSSQTFLAQITLRKVTKLRFVTFDNQITYQHLESDAVNLPQFVTYNSVYVTTSFLRKLIETNIGVDGLWFSEFYAPAFNPSLGVFSYQNDIGIGKYPIVNAFVSIKYKPVRVLLKYSGLYVLCAGKNFVIPHYPQASPLVSFAVSWQFFN